MQAQYVALTWICIYVRDGTVWKNEDVYNGFEVGGHYSGLEGLQGGRQKGGWELVVKNDSYLDVAHGNAIPKRNVKTTLIFHFAEVSYIYLQLFC